MLWCHLAGRNNTIRQLGCWLGDDHPLYHALPQTLAQSEPAETFYIRIPDLAAFVQRIAPVLEQRVARSIAAGYSGELRLNFYRDGLWLQWSAGRLTAVRNWTNPSVDDAGLSFPDLTFLQLLLGYRAFAELQHTFADCTAHDEAARVLVDILWPKHASQVWSLG